MLRPALVAIANFGPDIAVAQAFEGRSRPLAERGYDLDPSVIGLARR